MGSLRDIRLVLAMKFTARFVPTGATVALPVSLNEVISRIRMPMRAVRFDNVVVTPMPDTVKHIFSSGVPPQID